MMRRCILCFISLFVAMGINAQGVILERTNDKEIRILDFSEFDSILVIDKKNLEYYEIGDDVKYPWHFEWGKITLYNKLNLDVVPDGKINGHEYVDLGLPSGLKWATMNVGANSLEDYGGFYSWGETETKTVYDREHHKWTDYNYSQLQSKGYIDSNGNLTSNNDVACKKWGSTWRMPTRDEVKELCENCRWYIFKSNDEVGLVLVGPNGKKLFFPSTGCMYKTELQLDDSVGYFWSSTRSSDSFQATGLNIWAYHGDGPHYEDSSLSFGYTVRPVSK